MKLHIIMNECDSLVEYFSLFNVAYFTIQARDIFLHIIISIRSPMSTLHSLFHLTSSLVEVCLGGCRGSCWLYF